MAQFKMTQDQFNRTHFHTSYDSINFEGMQIKQYIEMVSKYIIKPLLYDTCIPDSNDHARSQTRIHRSRDITNLNYNDVCTQIGDELVHLITDKCKTHNYLVYNNKIYLQCHKEYAVRHPIIEKDKSLVDQQIQLVYTIAFDTIQVEIVESV